MPACLQCGSELSHKNKRDIIRKRFCSRVCRSKYHYLSGVGVSMLGGITKQSRKKQSDSLKKLFSNPHHHPGWKGGTKQDRRGGYIQERDLNGNYKSSHRIVAEKALGRPLKRNEVVHHVDGDPANNKNNNLVVCSQSYHTHLHAKMSFLYQQLMWGK